MPERSGRIFASHLIRFSRTVSAPPKFVYDWCTDFRSDDGRLSRSKLKPGYRVLRLGRDRVVRIRSSNPRAETRAIALELVRLSPPSRWHVDQIDESDLASVDYSVARLGPKKARVTLVIRERWMTPKHPGRDDYLADVTEYWDRLVAAIEKRYRDGLPARG